MGKRFRILAGDFDIYPNVTDFEIVTEENVKHLSGTLGGALVGGLFLGGAGTLVGALVGAKIRKSPSLLLLKAKKKPSSKSTLRCWNNFINKSFPQIFGLNEESSLFPNDMGVF